MLEKIKATANYIKERINASPEIGIILGTGLGGLVNEIEIIDSIPYGEIPNFPISTVDGHAGRLIYGKLFTAILLLINTIHIIHFLMMKF